MSLKAETKEWNDRAERAEWSFVAKIMNETLLGKTLHPLALVSAIKLARARAKTGWRSVKDSETSYPDSQPHLVNSNLLLEIEILKKALRDIRDLDNVSEITGFSSVALMGTIHLIGEISHNALGENQDKDVCDAYAPIRIDTRFDAELLKKIAIAARQVTHDTIPPRRPGAPQPDRRGMDVGQGLRVLCDTRRLA